MYRAPLAANLLFAGLAGAIWCSQFICLKTGEPAMGKHAYVGFAVLMAAPGMVKAKAHARRNPRNLAVSIAVSWFRNR